MKLPKWTYKESEHSEKIIDVEKLLFPHEFFLCYEYKKFVAAEIKKRKPEDALEPVKQVKQITSTQSIMKPDFPFKNAVVNTLIGFYSSDKFCEYHEYFKNKNDPNNKKWSSRDKVIEFYFKDFEEKLTQLLHTTTPQTQIDFFEEMKSEIERFSLYEASESHLREQMEEYNEWVKETLTRKDEWKFDRPELKYKDRKILWYHSLEVLDFDFVHEYIQVLQQLMNRFRSIVEPKIKLYNGGKIPALQNTFHAPSETPVKQSSLVDFFEKVKINSLPQLEIINHVQHLTDGNDNNKLKILLSDFENYFMQEKRKISVRYLFGDELFYKIKELQSNNQPIPFLEEDDPRVLPYKQKLPQLSDKFIDIEKLFFPNAFVHYYKFQYFLNSKISDQDISDNSPVVNQNREKTIKDPKIPSSKANRKNSNAINDESFLYSNKSEAERNINLGQLHDKLINAEPPFIKKPKDIRTFRKIFTGEKVTTPVIWKGTNYELNYFIKRLIENPNIEECNKPFAIAIKCFNDKDNNKIIYHSLRTATKLPAVTRQKLLKTMVESL